MKDKIKGLFSNKVRTLQILIVLLLVVVIAFSYYYGTSIAPYGYKIVSESVSNEALPDEFANFDIAFISDVNLKTDEDITKFEELVNDVNDEKVDMVIFGGDLYESAPFNNETVINILSSIKSSYGKFAVLGEKDLATLNDTSAVLNEGGFEILHNETRTIYYNNATIALFGLEANGDISGLINEGNQGMYKIVAVHEPDYFTSTSASGIALQLSGHSNGGYVILPFIGGILTKDNCKTYTSGTHTNNGATLIISNGVNGETGYDFRWLCPNQVNIVTLKK